MLKIGGLDIKCSSRKRKLVLIVITFHHFSFSRDVEAGLVMIGHNVWFAHTIPPNAQNFLTPGHCSAECTRDRIPETGIHIFNVLLHSHSSGSLHFFGSRLCAINYLQI